MQSTPQYLLDHQEYHLHHHPCPSGQGCHHHHHRHQDDQEFHPHLSRLVIWNVLQWKIKKKLKPEHS